MKISRLDEICPQRISYLITPYLPEGSLAWASGDPEAGKTAVVLSLAAAITTGKRHEIDQAREDDSKPEPRNVLFLSGEDAPHIIRERAAAAGADLKRLFVLTGDPTPLSDVAAYRKIVVEKELALVVLDPVQAFLGGVCTTSQGQVRAVLSPIIQLAQETGCVFLGLRHLTKSSGSRSAYRALGSIDFRAAARSVMRLGKDPHDPTRRIMVHSKSSLGPKGASQEYEIASDLEGKPRVHWLGRSEITEQELDARPRRRRGKSALDLAKEFLQDLVAAGPVPARQAREQAKAEGFAQRTLDTAKRELGVCSKRVAEEGHGRGHWLWGWPRDLGVSGPSEPDLPSGWPPGDDQGRSPEERDLDPGSDDRPEDDSADWWKRQ